MRIRLALGAALLGVAPIAFTGTAFASPAPDLGSARQATAAYHDIEAALAAGYSLELPDIHGETCIANLSDPSAGAMGIHMVNPGLLDSTLDPTQPEVLVYERRPDGSLKLAAVEYVAFKADVPDQPSLFGVPFDSNSGARYGLPEFWALHAWIWKPNNRTLDPAGMFAPWNPSVTC
jgi:hypothetical protein